MVIDQAADKRPTGGADDQERLAPGVGVVIGLLLAATFVMVLNETVMGIVIPQLMIDFSITAATAQWLTTAFMLTMAAVIPITGSILDRFRTRQVAFAALILFAAGTLLATVAPTFAVLLAARILQAGGTAVMVPLLMTTVLTFVPAGRRGRMMGLISIVIAVAPAIGPTIAGLVLEVLSWRWLFGIMFPVALIALVVGHFTVKDISETRPVRFDLPSIALSVIGFGGIVFGLSSIGEASEGHAIVPPVLPIVVGAVAMALFVRRQLRQQRTGTPLMDLRPFALRDFTMPLISLAITMAVLFGSLILLPLFLQNVLGLGALETGLMLLPGGIVMGAAAPVVGNLFDRFGPRPLVLPGSIGTCAGIAALSTVHPGTTVSTIVAIHVGLCLSIAFLITPLTTSALGALPPRLYSHGSAIANTLQQLAGAAGTALFVTLLSTGTAAATVAGAGPLEAQTSGMHRALIVAAAVAVVPVVLSLFLRRPAEESVRPAPLH